MIHPFPNNVAACGSRDRSPWSSVSAPIGNELHLRTHELHLRTHCAIVSVLNYRFFGSEVFVLGNLADGVFETTRVAIDGIMTLRQGADGAVMFYREFAKRLSTESTIYGIESPLLSDPEFQIPGNVEELAGSYVAAIHKIQPNGPYRIGGYSFGGVLA